MDKLSTHEVFRFSIATHCEMSVQRLRQIQLNKEKEKYQMVPLYDSVPL